MRLDLDFGNCLIKAQLSSDNKNTESVAVFSDTEQLTQYYSAYTIQRICVLSVRRDQTEINTLEQWAWQKFGIKPEYAKVTPQACGVVNAYDHPEHLGVDRWAAMLAAYHLQKEQTSIDSVLVIDCGTAITLDWLDETGQHLAGMIVPGLDALYFALEKKTGLKPGTVPTHNSNVLSGLALAKPDAHSSTEIAVNSGIDAMFNSFFQQQIKASFDRFQSAFSVYLSGGNAEYFRHYLPKEKLEYHPDLTLQGLRLILP